MMTNGCKVFFLGLQNFPHPGMVYQPRRFFFSEVINEMTAVLVGQFHARDAEGRIYPVHEFQEATLQADGSAVSMPITTYRLAIGDRVNHLGEDRFELVQSGVELIRVP